MNLLTKGNSVYKIRKSNESGLGYYSAILYLAPHKTSGVGNLCPNASAGCISCCLFSAGRGGMYSVQRARVRKTLLWYKERDKFLDMLNEDITKFIRRCRLLRLKPAIRLNGTSDIAWHNYIDMDEHSAVQFYDYTKDANRMRDFLANKLPPNYHLTFSRSETNDKESLELKRMGANVAVVFRPNIPTKWKRFNVFDGDKTDLRFLDPKQGFCGLSAKGKAKKDTTGFVVVT